MQPSLWESVWRARVGGSSIAARSIASVQESPREGFGVIGKPEYAPPGIRFPLLYPLVDSAGNPLVDPVGNLLRNSAGNFLADPRGNPTMQVLPSACLLDSRPNASATGGRLAPAWRGDSANCNSSGWQELVLTAGSSSFRGAAGHMPEQRWIAGVAEHAGYPILRLRYYPAWGVKVNGTPVTAMAERERGLMAVPVPQGNVQVSVDWTTTGDVVAGRWVSAVALLLITGLFLFERKLSRSCLAMGRTSPFISTEEPKLRDVIPSVRTGSRNTPSSKKPKNARRK